MKDLSITRLEQINMSEKLPRAFTVVRSRCEIERRGNIAARQRASEHSFGDDRASIWHFLFSSSSLNDSRTTQSFASCFCSCRCRRPLCCRRSRSQSCPALSCRERATQAKHLPQFKVYNPFYKVCAVREPPREREREMEQY